MEFQGVVARDTVPRPIDLLPGAARNGFQHPGDGPSADHVAIGACDEQGWDPDTLERVPQGFCGISSPACVPNARVVLPTPLSVFCLPNGVHQRSANLIQRAMWRVLSDSHHQLIKRIKLERPGREAADGLSALIPGFWSSFGDNCRGSSVRVARDVHVCEVPAHGEAADHG